MLGNAVRGKGTWVSLGIAVLTGLLLVLSGSVAAEGTGWQTVADEEAPPQDEGDLLELVPDQPDVPGESLRGYLDAASWSEERAESIEAWMHASEAGDQDLRASDAPSTFPFLWGDQGLASPSRPASGPTLSPAMEGCVPHPPIRIDGDDDFTTEDSPGMGETIHRPGSGVVQGEGTEEDPYVIEGWCIFTEHGIADQGIVVTGTEAHLVIRDVVVTSPSPVPGTWGDSSIVLDDVANVTLEESTVERSYLKGISVKQSEDVAILDNQVQDHMDVAIEIQDAHDVTVQGNDITGNSQNEANLAPSAVQMFSVTETVISQNTISANQGNGILAQDASHDQVDANTIQDNEGSGIVLVGADNATIEDNTLTGNGLDGVSLIVTENTTLDGNTITDNEEDGVFAAWFSTDDEILNNDLDGHDTGIHAGISKALRLDGNTIDSNVTDVDLSWSRDATLTDNEMTQGIELSGYSEGMFRHEIDISNHVDGSPVLYETDLENEVLTEPAGQIILVNATEVQIRDQYLTGTTAGVQIAFSDDVNVTQSTITDHETGIDVTDSSMINVHANDLVGNDVAIDETTFFVEETEDGVLLTEGATTQDGIDARWNWWGCSEGPTHEECDAVTGPVTVDPWLENPWEETFPGVHVSLSEACLDYTCTFEAHAFSLDGIDAYDWELGDGTTATGQTVTHSYDEVKATYNVTLTVTDNQARTNQTTRTVEVPGFLETSFDDGSIDLEAWNQVSYGSPDDLCGATSKPLALTFGGSGARYAETRTLPLADGANVSFTLKIGQGGPSSSCESADGREGVEFQYSTDEGETWHTLAYYAPNDFGSFTQVLEKVPRDAAGEDTMFRWIQPAHSGNGYDNWAIDDVHIDAAPAPSPPLPDLVVDEIQLDPPQPEEGDEVNFTAVIANQGDAPSNETVTQFQVDGRYGYWITLETPPLEPETNVSVTTPSLSSLNVGDHSIHVTADATFEETELAEENNTKERLFSVVLPTPAIRCQAPCVETFDNGGTPLFATTGLWHVARDCADPPSSSYYLGYHRDDACDYQTSGANRGSAILAADLTGLEDPRLGFDHRHQTEALSPYDAMRLEVSTDGGDSWSMLEEYTGEQPISWTSEIVNLSEHVSDETLIRWVFNTIDSIYNDYEGWFLDNVAIADPGEDPAVTGIETEKLHLRTDYTDPLVNPAGSIDVEIDVANLGTKGMQTQGTVDAYACPQDGDIVDFPAMEGCETIGEETVHLGEGGEDHVTMSWQHHGSFGDFEVCANLQYVYPDDPANDVACTETFVLVGGTGLGGVRAS